MFLRRLYIVLAALVIGAILLFPRPGDAGDAFVDLGLELQTAEVSDSVMDEARGRNFGFIFNIDFTGYWDTMGTTPMANLTYSAGFGSSGASGQITLSGNGDGDALSSDDVSDGDSDGEDGYFASSSDNTSVSTSVIMGGGGSVFNGAGGITQVTQAPGDWNRLTTGLVVNLWVLNVKDTPINAAEGFRALLPYLISGGL